VHRRLSQRGGVTTVCVPADMIADSGAMAVQYGNKAIMCNQLPAANASDAWLVNAFANFTNTFWGASFGSNCFYDTNCLINNPSQYVADCLYSSLGCASSVCTRLEM
jgi:hypothetical protein